MPEEQHQMNSFHTSLSLSVRQEVVSGAFSCHVSFVEIWGRSQRHGTTSTNRRYFAKRRRALQSKDGGLMRFRFVQSVLSERTSDQSLQRPQIESPALNPKARSQLAAGPAARHPPQENRARPTRCGKPI